MACHLPPARLRTAETGFPPGHGLPSFPRMARGPKPGTRSLPSLTFTPETAT